ncbi:hypothetical protein AALA13_07390 [Lachnospiraceae bacterium 50-23]
MEEKNSFGMISNLINSMDEEEKTWAYHCLSYEREEQMQDMAFHSLKNSKLVFGGVHKVHNFLPVGIYIEGWFLPRNNYDCIEIYSGSKFIGKAALGILRLDVYKDFPFFNEKRAGFNYFIALNNKELADRPITVLVKFGGEIIEKYIMDVEGTSVQDSLDELKAHVLSDQDNILVPTLSNRLKMIHKLKTAMPEYNFINLIEGMESSIEEVEKNLQQKEQILEQELNELQLFMAPIILQKNSVPIMPSGIAGLNEDEKALFNKYDFLGNAGKNLSRKYAVTEEYADQYSLAAHEYAQKILSVVKPKCILLWNMYSPWHLILDKVCKQKKIPVVYMESGLLPGTYAFETMGQMGGSYPALMSKEFCSLPVTNEEIETARRIKEQLYKNKLNRWSISDASVYDSSEKDRILGLLDKTRPTILYAGQNDFDSGLFPYTAETKKIHSPAFVSSDEAAVFLGKLAKKNRWNMIYKRHPMMQGRAEVLLPKNIIVSNKMDIHDAIDVADLTITILSQTSYVALIRNKPALMLGYHQLCGKGCAYEAYERSDIEDTIKKALNKGFTVEMQKSFQVHMAQLCRYYLYTDFIDGRVTFGKSEKYLIKYLKNIIATQSLDAEYDVREEWDINGIQSKEQKTFVSEFYLNLSSRERVKRRYLKYILSFEAKIGKYKKLAEILVESLSVKGSFEKNLMYISQLEQDELSKNHWSSAFCSIFSGALSEGTDTVYNFVSKCRSLDAEIRRRLEIDHNLYKGIQKIILDEEKAGLYLRVCIAEGKRPQRGYFVETLCNHVLSFDKQEREKVQICIESIIVSKGVKFSEKCSLLQLLFKMGLFTSKYMKLWNHLLMDTDEVEYLYYYGGLEIGWIGFVSPECVYPEYYRDRKKILKYLSDKAAGEVQCLTPKRKVQSKRISVIVTGLHGRLMASMRLEMGISNELARRGYEVKIHVADTNYIIDSNRFAVPPTTIRKNFSTMFKQDHWAAAEPNVTVEYFDVKEDVLSRYQRYINSIHEFHPEFILDFTQDHAIYNTELRKYYPVITIPLNGYCSSADFDTYIARNISLMEQCNQVFHSIDCKNIYEANVYLPQEVNEKIRYERRHYGISRDDFLIVTVGNRLDYELTEEVQKDMYYLLNNLDHVRWILVGNIKNSLPVLEDLIANRRVLKWGYEKNLEALYRMCNIYLNLPRSGGGGSVAYAVQVGIPALICNIPSDILPFLGVENSAENWREELKMLLKAMDNKVFYKKLLFNQQKSLKSERWSIENFVNVLEKAMKDINKHGE